MEEEFYDFEPLDEKEKEKLKKKIPKDIREFYKMINKSRKVSEVLGIDERTIDKIYSRVVVDLQKCFVSRSRIEASYLLLRDVLKVPVDDIDVEMVLNAIVVTDVMLLAYKYIWAKCYPRDYPPFVPLIVEGLKAHENVDVV